MVGPWWWSACSPSTPTIRVQIPLKHTVFSVKFVLKKNEIKQKEAGLAHFFEKNDPFVSNVDKNWGPLTVVNFANHSLDTNFTEITILQMYPTIS